MRRRRWLASAGCPNCCVVRVERDRAGAPASARLRWRFRCCLALVFRRPAVAGRLAARSRAGAAFWACGLRGIAGIRHAAGGPREAGGSTRLAGAGGGPPVRGDRGPGSFTLRVNGPLGEQAVPDRLRLAGPARSPPCAPATPEAGPPDQTLSRGVGSGPARRGSSRLSRRGHGAHARIFRRRCPGTARERAPGALSPGRPWGRGRPVACPQRASQGAFAA